MVVHDTRARRCPRRLPERVDGLAPFHELVASHSASGRPAQVVVVIETTAAVREALPLRVPRVSGEPEAGCPAQGDDRRVGEEDDFFDAGALADMGRTRLTDPASSPRRHRRGRQSLPSPRLIWTYPPRGAVRTAGYFPAALHAYAAFTLTSLALGCSPGAYPFGGDSPSPRSRLSLGRAALTWRAGTHIQAALRTAHLPPPSPRRTPRPCRPPLPLSGPHSCRYGPGGFSPHPCRDLPVPAPHLSHHLPRPRRVRMPPAATLPPSPLYYSSSPCLSSCDAPCTPATSATGTSSALPRRRSALPPHPSPRLLLLLARFIGLYSRPASPPPHPSCTYRHDAPSHLPTAASLL